VRALAHGGRRAIAENAPLSVETAVLLTPTPIRFVAMDPGTWVALFAALPATVVAVVVPWATFRFAMRQDQVR